MSVFHFYPFDVLKNLKLLYFGGKITQRFKNIQFLNCYNSKGGEIVRARDYWIFLVAQHEMSRLEMDELELLGI